MTTASPLQCPICAMEILDAPGGESFFCPRPSCGVEFLPGEPLQLRTFRLVDHYSLFVLPFAFDTEGTSDPIARLEESGRWRRRVFSVNDPGDVDRTEYFLPYIRRFLFPTLYDAENPQKGKPTLTSTTCRHYEFDLARMGECHDPGQGCRWTLHCRDSRKKLSFAHDVLLTRAELIVFRSRVGFLVLHVRCAGPNATYFEQMNTVAYLRTIAPLYRGFTMPQLDAGATRYQVPQLLPFLLAEFAGRPVIPATPDQVMPGTPLPVKPVYDDRMMVYTFSCLDKDTCLDDGGRAQALLHRGAVVAFDADATTRPLRERVENDPMAWLRTRWQAFSKDGGSLVVFNTDAYHERYAGLYHATYYFDIFLLATLQRVTLLTLYERLADIQALTKGGSASRRLLRRVRRDLLLFKNQVWFSQITNRERGLVLWKKWKRTLETQTLFKEVNEQSEELDSYLQSRYRERMERLMRVGGFVAAAVPLVLGIDAVFNQAEWAVTLRWLLLGLVILGASVAAWFVFFRNPEET